MEGFGKTTLALEAAKQSQAEHPQRSIMIVQAGPEMIGPEALLGVIGTAFGDSFRAKLDAQSTWQKKQQLIYSFLANQKPIIIFDDVWDLPSLSAFLEHTPKAVSIIVTTSYRVDMGTSAIQVGPLDAADAFTLVEGRRGKGKFATNEANDVRKICAILGQHPYALTVAAAALRTQTASELKKKLEEGMSGYA